MNQNKHHIADVAIIGSGAAGLSLALSLANYCNVTVISKGALTEGSTLYAQGGIAAVFDKQNDSIESHVEDTLDAGGGLCDRDAVHYTASNAHDCLQWLIDQGVPFDMEFDSKGKERFHLTREGGHSHRRILHAADATGKAVQTTLISQVKIHKNITLLEQYNAIDLITDKSAGKTGSHIEGMYVWNKKAKKVETISAKFVALATGGASKVYLYTSNPDVSSGDGIAMAWGAGCKVANMEFNNFIQQAFIIQSYKTF